MSKRAKPPAKLRGQEITWDRVRSIFDNPSPPKSVWERQFDCFDDKLQKLASTPFDEIDFSDLWYYHHDLAYVDLQPDLFDYLFPVCLMDWHETLMNNKACSHGDSEFHFGVHQGKVFDKMLTPERREQVADFMRDSFLERLDGERKFAQIRSRAPTFCWISRFNSLAIILPNIHGIWNTWWSLDTQGRAIAAIQYCSGLMYFDGDNPLFDEWNGMSPSLLVNDSTIYDAGWRNENADFLHNTLTIEFVNRKVGEAVAQLKGCPEHEKAQRVEKDLNVCQELIAARIQELPSLLRTSDAAQWTV